MFALEAQVKQLGFQAAQDCERLTKDKTLTLQLLHKVCEPEDAHEDAGCTGDANLTSTICFRNKKGCTVWRAGTRLQQEGGASYSLTAASRR